MSFNIFGNVRCLLPVDRIAACEKIIRSLTSMAATVIIVKKQQKQMMFQKIRQ
jgi:hypothetical protein